MSFLNCFETVHGMEYSFGAHDYPSSGVFEVEPKKCPGFIYRCSILLGRTDMPPSEFRAFIENMAADYHGDTYQIISKNCNHFTDDASLKLTGRSIPGWVNRLAKIGKLICIFHFFFLRYLHALSCKRSNCLYPFRTLYFHVFPLKTLFLIIGPFYLYKCPFLQKLLMNWMIANLK